VRNPAYAKRLHSDLISSILPKHVGSKCDYVDERNDFLLHACKAFAAECFRQSVDISVPDQMEFAVAYPAPRFWISESRAIEVISRMERGLPLKSERFPERNNLYRVIFAKYVEFRKLRPTDSLEKIVFDVVNSPAPRSFIDPNSAKVILVKHRKKISSGERLDINRNAPYHNVSYFDERIIRQFIYKNSCFDSLHNSDICLHNDTKRSTDATDDIFELDSAESDPSADVHDDSCEHMASYAKCVLDACAGISVQCQNVALDSIASYSSMLTRRANRRHTNVRYISGQLRIDWDSDCFQ